MPDFINFNHITHIPYLHALIDSCVHIYVKRTCRVFLVVIKLPTQVQFAIGNGGECRTQF